MSELRAALSWTTPAVSTSLTGATTDSSGSADHADHASPAAERSTDLPNALPVISFAKVLSAARAINIDSVNLEIRPSQDPNTAWVVQETQRFYPTQVDSVAIDPYAYTAIDRTDFAAYPPSSQTNPLGNRPAHGHPFWVGQPAGTFCPGSCDPSPLRLGLPDVVAAASARYPNLG